MLSFCLPHKQETQLMKKMVEQIRDKSNRLSDRFKRMTDSAATRAICDRLGVSNEFMRVECGEGAELVDRVMYVVL